jgi:hypothetical protein
MGDEYRFGWVALGAGVISEAIDVLLRGRTLMVRQLARVTSVGLTLTTLYFVVIAQSSVLYWSLSDCMSASILTTMVCMSTVALMRATTPATA